MEKLVSGIINGVYGCEACEDLDIHQLFDLLVKQSNIHNNKIFNDIQKRVDVFVKKLENQIGFIGQGIDLISFSNPRNISMPKLFLDKKKTCHRSIRLSFLSFLSFITMNTLNHPPIILYVVRCILSLGDSTLDTYQDLHVFFVRLYKSINIDMRKRNKLVDLDYRCIENLSAFYGDKVFDQLRSNMKFKVPSKQRGKEIDMEKSCQCGDLHHMKTIGSKYFSIKNDALWVFGMYFNKLKTCNYIAYTSLIISIINSFIMPSNHFPANKIQDVIMFIEQYSQNIGSSNYNNSEKTWNEQCILVYNDTNYDNVSFYRYTNLFVNSISQRTRKLKIFVISPINVIYKHYENQDKVEDCLDVMEYCDPKFTNSGIGLFHNTELYTRKTYTQPFLFNSNKKNIHVLEYDKGKILVNASYDIMSTKIKKLRKGVKGSGVKNAISYYGENMIRSKYFDVSCYKCPNESETQVQF